MPNGTFGQGTIITDPQESFRKDQEAAKAERNKRERAKCLSAGGTWDDVTGTCSLPLQRETDPAAIKAPVPETPEQVAPKTVSAAENPKGYPVITDAQGNQIIQTPELFEQGKLELERIRAAQGGVGAAAGVEARRIQQEQLAAGQQLAGGVGQFGELGVSPTGLNTGAALAAGLTDAIPSAIKQAGLVAGGGAALGGAIGTAGGPLGTGGGAVLGAAIGGAAGFVSSLSSSMISDFKGQRRDTTTAQQRVLDEGKQTMKDWATLAKNDPANKANYLAQYNQVSAQIDQAYRQMKLDTSQDLAKFETALPNLAEFEAFYAAGGERDTLDIEMRNSLLAVSPPNYEMIELAYRRRAGL